MNRGLRAKRKVGVKRAERGVGANIHKGLKKKRPENGEGVNRGIMAEREIRTERGVRVNRRI